MGNSRKERDIEKFDQLASSWHASIPNDAITCMNVLIERFHLTSEQSILDVAAGTGILLSRLSGMNQLFDIVMIYNSIPHFQNLDPVFRNAYDNLEVNGKFIIAHSRTRTGIMEHHQKIGYISEHDPIPSDSKLIQLSKMYHFGNCAIHDEDFFYYCGEKY